LLFNLFEKLRTKRRHDFNNQYKYYKYNFKQENHLMLYSKGDS